MKGREGQRRIERRPAPEAAERPGMSPAHLMNETGQTMWLWGRACITSGVRKGVAPGLVPGGEHI